jgi:hypothetical protein
LADLVQDTFSHIQQKKSLLFLLLKPFSEVYLPFYGVDHSLVHYIAASFRKESSILEGGTLK